MLTSADKFDVRLIQATCSQMERSQIFERQRHTERLLPIQIQRKRSNAIEAGGFVGPAAQAVAAMACQTQFVQMRQTGGELLQIVRADEVCGGKAPELRIQAKKRQQRRTGGLAGANVDGCVREMGQIHLQKG